MSYLHMARVHILHTCVLSLLPLSDHFELRWSLGVSTDGVASLAAHAWLRKARSAARRFMRAYPFGVTHCQRSRSRAHPMADYSMPPAERAPCGGMRTRRPVPSPARAWPWRRGSHESARGVRRYTLAVFSTAYLPAGLSDSGSLLTGKREKPAFGQSAARLRSTVCTYAAEDLGASALCLSRHVSARAGSEHDFAPLAGVCARETQLSTKCPVSSRRFVGRYVR